jgi:hypothetical protein
MTTSRRSGPPSSPSANEDGSKARPEAEAGGPREDANKLNAIQERLAPKFGFRPTLSQTLSWLIQQAEGALPPRGKQ